MIVEGDTPQAAMRSDQYMNSKLAIKLEGKLEGNELLDIPRALKIKGLHFRKLL
ncbi:hypothetical protein [Paenibacillus agricola]|uniref:hypothetical protein n=1 Tax=Paenibacillus agricola TaxID=2716264 RepID=UPI001A9FAB2C|nr:hypothetical protein [Paenibacillus agricola]